MSFLAHIPQMGQMLALDLLELVLWDLLNHLDANRNVSRLVRLFKDFCVERIEALVPNARIA